MKSFIQRVRENWDHYVQFPAEGAVAESNGVGPWAMALLLVISVAWVDRQLQGGATTTKRFFFDLGWFAPALLFRLGYRVARGPGPRPVDKLDRDVNALDTFFVMVCPAAIAITGNSWSELIFGSLFFLGSLFYAWVGGSDFRHPWSSVLVSMAAAVPMVLYRGDPSLMFLGFVLVPAVVTGTILGGHSRAKHAELGVSFQERERVYASDIASAARTNEQLNRMLVNLAGAHHDVANALTGALLSSAKLHRNPGSNEDVKRLQAQLLALKDILGTVRAMSREADPSSLDPLAPGSVESALDHACRLLAEADVSMEVHRDLEPECPPVLVKGGQLGLCRILYNLLLNAAQGDGTRGATHATVTVRRSGARAVVSVSDNGTGFSADQLSAPIQIFQSTKTDGGSGLGLASVEFAVREGGGILRRSNGAAGGAVVSFDLRTVSG